MDFIADAENIREVTCLLWDFDCRQRGCVANSQHGYVDYSQTYDKYTQWIRVGCMLLCVAVEVRRRQKWRSVTWTMRKSSPSTACICMKQRYGHD